MSNQADSTAFPPGPRKTRQHFPRQARHPSAYAPTASEFMNPPPWVPPGPPPMSAQERALLDAVLASPDEDGPRRQYAAWLRENHDTRGEFIDEQLAVVKTQSRPPEPDPAWLQLFFPWGAEDIVFRRGFAEEMSLTGRSFVSLGASLFQTTPLLGVRLVAVQHIFLEFIACPLLSRLRKLDLWGNQIGAAGALALRNCPYFQQLREMNLSGNGLGDAGARLILGAPWLPQLTTLDLTDNQLSEETIAELTAQFGTRLRV